MKKNVHILECKKTSFRVQIQHQKCKNQIVWFILDSDKHAFEWTFSLLEDNGVMIDWCLVGDGVLK